MKTLLITMMGLLSVAMVSAEFCGEQATPQEAAATALPEKAEMLATNTVLAEYLGTVDLPCRFMTALCPDKCNHATKLAQFKVSMNEHYEKPGKYGDDRLNPGDIATVDVKKPVLGQSPEVAQFISQLKEGDKVRLTITHYYVTQGQGQFPVRPAVKIERAE